MVRIKICSLTNLEDALYATNCGADALGFIFADAKRRLDPETARDIIRQLPPFVVTVGVFMNQTLADVREIAEVTGIDTIQLHGDEPPDFCRQIRHRLIKRIKVEPHDTSATLEQKMALYNAAAFVLDPGAGSGAAFDWKQAANLSKPVIIAGGLTPENVGQAIQIARPYGVDVSSGVELQVGKKDPLKVKSFIQAANFNSND